MFNTNYGDLKRLFLNTELADMDKVASKGKSGRMCRRRAIVQEWLSSWVPFGRHVYVQKLSLPDGVHLVDVGQILDALPSFWKHTFEEKEVSTSRLKLVCGSMVSILQEANLLHITQSGASFLGWPDTLRLAALTVYILLFGLPIFAF